MREGLWGRGRSVLRRSAAVAVLALVPALMVAAERAAAAAPTCQVIGVVPVAIDGSVIITLNCSDADGDRLHITTSDPAHGSVSPAPGNDNFTYTPDAGYEGDDGFTYKANDGTTDSGDTAVIIKVRALGIGDTCNAELITIYGIGRVNGTPGDDVMGSLQSSPDLYTAGGGSDTACSGNGNDQVRGGPGNDLLNGGAGDDTLDGGAGATDFLGGGVGQGTDTATYRGSSPAVVVDFAAGADNRGGQLTDMEIVVGTESDDQVIGSAANEGFEGRGGNDSFLGRAGADFFRGGGGGGGDVMLYTDRLAAEPVTVTARGGGGANDGGDLDGLPGARDDIEDVENITGGAGNDTLTGNGDANTLIGGLGADSLFGLRGVDLLNAADGVADVAIDCGPEADQAPLFDAGLDPAPVNC